MRLDFLALNAAQEASPRKAGRGKQDEPLAINIPRETAAYVDSASEPEETEPEIQRVPAYIPISYVSDSRQRVEMYRRIAELDDKAAIETLREEMTDRFGKLPEAVDLLLQVADLKIIAASKAITAIESRGSKLMLTRNQDYVMVGGKFPRLTRPTAKARLQEIRKLLNTMAP
jgi:transcription-repair coupling factor (superfamily II helicase)